MIRVTAYKQTHKQQLLNCAKTDLSESEFTALEKDLDFAQKDNCPFEYLVCLDENEQIIGYSKTTPLKPGYINLDDIFVAKNFRRDKNGSVILVAVMQRAVNNLTVGIFAKCSENKSEALAFFKARGFTCYQIENGVHYLTKSLLPMYKHE